jgi:Ca2+-binding EF-hand superfamily protein
MKAHLIAIFLIAMGLGQVSAAERRPLLFPNPENPGPAPLEQVRAEMLARFDKDNDGFLDKKERETIRLSTKQEANDRMERFLESRKRSRGKEEEQNRPPSRWLKLYDKNKNNRFDNGEWEVAFPTEVKRVTALYDKDADEQLNENEKKTVIADSRSEKFNGYDRYILRNVGGLEGKEASRNSRRGRESRWAAFDSDGDGKASSEELSAIRDHEARQGGSNDR